MTNKQPKITLTVFTSIQTLFFATKLLFTFFEGFWETKKRICLVWWTTNFVFYSLEMISIRSSKVEERGKKMKSLVIAFLQHELFWASYVRRAIEVIVKARISVLKINDASISLNYFSPSFPPGLCFWSTFRPNLFATLLFLFYL